MVDVCGHGVPAAGELPPGHFVTAVYVYVDLERRPFDHASAGHPPALVWRAALGSVSEAGPTGPLLISLAPAEYPVVERTFGPGDDCNLIVLEA